MVSRKFILLVLSAAQGILAQIQPDAVSQALAQFPSCATTCMVTEVSKSECAVGNLTCVCSNAPLQQQLLACVTRGCDTIDMLATQNATQTACGRPVRDLSTKYTGMVVTFCVVAGLFIAQRIGYKVYARIPIAIDDYLAVAVMMMVLTCNIMSVKGLFPNGFGRDVWTLTPDMITNFSRFFFVQEKFYYTLVTLTKLSLLFSFLRIFPDPHVRRLIWGTIVFTALYGACFVLVAIFQCSPINYFWHRWDGKHQGKCINSNAFTCTHAGISIALDLWMLALPMWQVKSLQLDWKKKVGVCLMLCVGTFVTVVSILRFNWLVRFQGASRNPTYDYFSVGLWSAIEGMTGVICICLPSLRVLLVRLFPKVMGTVRRTQTHPTVNTSSFSTAAQNIRSRDRELPHDSDTETSVPRSYSIYCQKDFTVEYNETDATELLEVKGADVKHTVKS